MIAPPKFMFDSLLRRTGATITATSEELPGYPKDNAYDWLPFTSWKPNAGISDLVLVLPAAAAADYFCIAYCADLATNGGNVALAYSTAGTAGPFTTVATITPTDSAAKVTTFASVSAATWRVRVTSTPESRIGIVAFGPSLSVPVGDRVGMSPPEWARDTKIMNNVSDGGKFLGRSKISDGFQMDFKFNFWSPTFITASWMTFIESFMELNPFFVQWSPDEYPTSVAYAWSDGMIGKPAFTKPVFTGFTLKIRGTIKP
jgi:hypothetical protein